MLPIDVEVHADESVQSYLLRLSAANRLRTSDVIYDILGTGSKAFSTNMVEVAKIRRTGKGALNANAVRQLEIPSFAPGASLQIGAVKLRAHQYDFNRRRYSSTFLNERDYYHFAWHLDFLPFCPLTFELLRERCPHPDCRKLLEWRVCRGARYCDNCGYNLCLVTPAYLEPDERAAVEPIMRLCFGNEVQRAQAELSLSPMYRKLSVGVLLQQPALFGRVLRAQRGVFRDFRDTINAEAIREEFIEGAHALSKTEIFDSIIAAEPQLRQSAFTTRMRLAAKSTFTPEVQSFVAELSALLKPHSPTHFAEIRRERKKRDLMSITEATHALGIKNKARVRDIIDAGLWATETDPGDFVRTHYIRRADFLALVKDIEDRIELNEAFQLAGWRFHQVDQMVACNLLQWHPNAALPLLFKSKYLDARSLNKLISTLRGVLPQCAPGPDWISLLQLFRSMGPVHKPLAQLIALQLKGQNFLGIEREDRPLTPDNLVVPSQLIGAVARGHVEWDIPIFNRHHMSQIEAQEYLNLHPKTTAQLLEAGALEYVSLSSTDLTTESVEAVGERYIGALEIAARLGISPLHVAKWMRDRGLKKPSPGLDLWHRIEAEEYLPLCRYPRQTGVAPNVERVSGRPSGYDAFGDSNTTETLKVVKGRVGRALPSYPSSGVVPA